MIAIFVGCLIKESSRPKVSKRFVRVSNEKDAQFMQKIQQGAREYKKEQVIKEKIDKIENEMKEEDIEYEIKG